MLKMSTQEQCQVLSGGKKAEYFERLRWECPLRYEEGLSIFAGLPVRWGWRSTYIGVSLTTSSNAIPLPFLVITRDVVGAASFTCSTLAENFGKVICEVFDRMPIISAKLSVHVTGADKARKVRASSISEIGPRGL
ncbi:hypothetical protein ACFX1Z_007148 [Malus domestica]